MTKVPRRGGWSGGQVGEGSHIKLALGAVLLVLCALAAFLSLVGI